jgi:Fic family protein
MNYSDFMNVASFEPAGAATELVAQLKEAIAEINSKRPLPTEVLERLQTDIMYDRVHSSAVTEGNRLSKRETIVVLTAGLVEAGKRRDVLEVENLAKAILEVDNALTNGVPLDEGFIRHLHAILLDGLDDTAGRFRLEDVIISGAKVRPPIINDVPDLVRSVLAVPELRSDDPSPIQVASWLHWAFTRIHPFRDGNGRIARLLQDYVLLKSKYVPAPLQPEDRELGYYAALEAADLGDTRPILELVAKNTLRMADRYLSIVRDEDAKHNWAKRITRVATEKVNQAAYRRFLNVQRASNILKSEFTSLASEIEIPNLKISIRDYGNLEFEKYQEIKNKGSAKRTWLFGVDLQIDETSLRYRFWYGTHHSRPWDEALRLPSDVVLLVSQEESDYFHLLDDLKEDRVSVREIVPDGGHFWRRRFDPISGRDEWDQGLTGSQITQNFFEEVFAKLGLI